VLVGRSLLRAFVAVAAAMLLPHVIGCPDPNVGGTKSGPRSDKANQWFKRAADEFKALDLAEASDSISKAIAGAPGDHEIMLLAARIHLASLDFKAAAKDLEGIESSEAAALRARAYWYSDDLPKASENIVHALEDPQFKDPWAKPIRELAGTQGTGRKPFNIKDSSARVIEMRMPRDLGSLLVVPIEIDGQLSVAILDTGVPEVILDQKARSSPGWVSIKFASADGQRSMEFRDVPAFVQDLSPFTKGQQVPIGAIIGMNFLRRLHLTIDRLADQLVLRREDPPPPPTMTKIPTTYFNGGGMLIRGTQKAEFELSCALWVNTGTEIPLAYPDSIYKRLGVDLSNITAIGNAGNKVVRLKNIRVGGLDLGPADTVAGASQIDELLAKFRDVEACGQVGMGFMASMRTTIGDNGRSLWVETDQNTPLVLAPPSAGSPAAKPQPKPGASVVAPKASVSAVPPKASAAPPKTSAPAPKASAPPATSASGKK
jgi:hypothetical protein